MDHADSRTLNGSGITDVEALTASLRLGIRENWLQFSLLVIVNALVGALIGLERSILPALAEQEFGLVARTGILSFIIVFGVSKALTNYVAGRMCDRFGRRGVLISGWLLAVPIPFLLMWAPSWAWILFANALLGVSQGLTWSTTVIMKIDLAGPSKRGLAMGLNEFAGYFALALSAFASGWIAQRSGLRPAPFYLGAAFVAVGLGLSLLVIRETKYHGTLRGIAVERQQGCETDARARDFLEDDALRPKPVERSPGRVHQQSE